MKFEDLQAVWDSQNDKPVFAMQDPRLLVALYQQREQSRRRLFRKEFAPMYVVGLGMLVGIGFMYFVFYMKSIRIEKIARDFPMSSWDYVAFAVAAAALLAVVVPMYVERKWNERTQNVFAPSLQEELDRGIAQLDFELHVQSPARVFRIVSLVYVAALTFVWEVGRLNGNTVPRLSPVVWLPMVFLWLFSAASWLGLTAEGKGTGRLRAQKRGLEAMRMSLDESTEVVPAPLPYQ